MVKNETVGELAAKARQVDALREEVEALREEGHEMRARQVARQKADSADAAAWRKDVLVPVETSLRAALLARAEILAQHVPREIVKAESIAASTVERLRRGVDRRRRTLDRAEALVKKKGAEGDETLQRDLANAGAELEAERDKLVRAQLTLSKARDALKAAMAKVMES